jgi:hypothetical protein
MRCAWSVGVVLVVAAVGACGDSRGDACEKYVDAFLNSDCSAFVASPSGFASVKSRALDACANLMALEGTSFTPAFAEQCAAAVPVTGCIPIALEYGACATKPGSLPVGAACQDDAQCESTRCDTTSSPCGTCLPSIPEGGDCSGLGLCVSGTMCTQGTCTAPMFAASGEACDDTMTFCKSGLVCTGTCGAPGNAGDPCFRYSDCASGLQCSDASGTGGRCIAAPAPTFASPGEPCSDTTPCFVGLCANGVCPMPIADGQPCSATSGAPCDFGSTCFGGKCQRVYAVACQ